MNLLAYLIPAIREVRAPLIGGYLWLLAAWLFFGRYVPVARHIEPGSPWADLHRLADAIGPAGAVLAVSTVAYLLGSLVDEPVSALVARLGDRPIELEDEDHETEYSIVGRRFNTERLEALAESVPEVRWRVDSALRAASEASLRLHVALPLVVIAVAFAVRREWPWAVPALAASGLIASHGVGLLRRARRRGRSAETFADDRRKELSAEEVRQKAARVEVRTRQEPRVNGVGQEYFIQLRNVGNGTARHVTLEEPDASPWSLARGTLPIKELHPGEEVDVRLSVSMGTPPEADVMVRWVDETGSQSYTRSVRIY